MSYPPALSGAVSDQGPENRRADSWPRQQRTPPGVELLSDVSDLATGLGLLSLALLSFTLPAPALTALAAALLLIRAFLGATLAARRLLPWRWRRAHGRPSRAANLLDSATVKPARCLGSQSAAATGNSMSCWK